MHKKEFSKRIDQFCALSKRTQEEMENERPLEVAQLLQDEVMPRIKSLYNELEPYILALRARDEALEGSVKPLVIESEVSE